VTLITQKYFYTSFSFRMVVKLACVHCIRNIKSLDWQGLEIPDFHKIKMPIMQKNFKVIFLT